MKGHHYILPKPSTRNWKPSFIVRCPTVAIRCKFCGSSNIVKYGTRLGIQQYLCRNCGRKFSDKDTPEDKQTPTAEIGATLSMFYDGLSFADISRQLQGIFNDSVNPSTIYRWIIEYSAKAIYLLDSYKAKVSDTWVVDETVVKISGENMWYWDVIDEGTRFLIDTRLSKSRTIRDVVTLFEKCQRRTVSGPNFIISDRLAAYIDGIERVFGAEAKHIPVVGLRLGQ